MRKIILVFAALLIINVSKAQVFHTSLMNFQTFYDGTPGKPSISSRNDTIIINPDYVSITNYVYNSHKTSTFKVSSIKEDIYTCVVDESEFYQVYVKDGWVIVDRYIGDEMTVRRKYLIIPKL